MAELPEHVKAKAELEVAKTGLDQKFSVKDMGQTTGADAYDTQAMAAQREQQRENNKAPEQEQTEEIKPEETPKQ